MDMYKNDVIKGACRKLGRAVPVRYIESRNFFMKAKIIVKMFNI